jgi:hypothetical protein
MRSARATLSDSGPKSGSNQNAKSRAGKDDSSDSEPSGNPSPKPGLGKSANNGSPEASQEKSNPAPVIAALDPTPAVLDPPVQLRSAEAPASQPHSNPEPAVPIEIFALPQPPASSGNAAVQSPATPATESSDDDSQAPLELGNLVFQLSLDPSEFAQKAHIAPAEDGRETDQHETGSFLSSQEIPSNPQPQSGASGSDTKSQDQPEQQSSLLPQLASAGPALAVDGTIASQFGFQTPLSFAVQTAAPKAESIAAPAPARMAENIPPPDLPMASSIDRVGLTIRGADDQVVRVEISQSGELVQVGVHTGNSDLASELRASVPELMHRLDQQGYESRLSLPGVSFASAVPTVMGGAHSEFRSGADTQGNPKSNGDAAPQEELRQQRQRNPQRSWRELASQLQED